MDEETVLRVKQILTGNLNKRVTGRAGLDAARHVLDFKKLVPDVIVYLSGGWMSSNTTPSTGSLK